MLWQNLKKKMIQYKDQSIQDEHTAYSFSVLIEKAEELSEHIADYTKCGILCSSELNTALALLACLSSQTTAVPLSLRYGNIHCQKILTSVDIQCLIIDDIQCLSGLENYSGAVYLIGKGFLKETSPVPEDPDCKDCALIMCSSGTTGTPKGVMITEQNLWTNLQDIDSYFKIAQHDHILIIRPLYHCAVLTGEFLISLMKGCSIIFDNSAFNPINILKTIQKNSVTVLCGTPTLFYYLCGLAAKQAEPLPLKTIAVSGECMTPTVAKRMREALKDTDIYNVYGLTEASPRVSCLPPEQFDGHPLSVGYPLKSLYVKVVDKNGQAVSPDTDGELLIQGQSVMKGYYRNPTETNKALDSGWLHTRDLASIDKEGRITIKSRIDSLIIRAGMNIYPQEIENALKCDSRILDVLAYGIRNADVGQHIGIKVVTKDLDYKQVFELCKQKLTLFQLPDKLEIVDSIPRNASGKIIRCAV